MTEKPTEELTKASNPPSTEERSRTERYRKLAAMLGDWLEEPGDYDDEIWPLVESELKDGGTRIGE